MKPLFKYPGGKSAEYKYFKKFFPIFNIYVEPFLGGGAVFWAINAKEYLINDFSKELISIYLYTKEQDTEFLSLVEEIGRIWNKKTIYMPYMSSVLKGNLKLSEDYSYRMATSLLQEFSLISRDPYQLNLYLKESLKRKITSLERVSKKEIIRNWEDNALGVLGSAIYTYLRNIYNHTSFSSTPKLKTALYLYLREYSYSSMFRYNAAGFFNVPFGGNSYAKKDFLLRFRQITDDNVINKLQDTNIRQGDFSDAIIDAENTFMFLDPPYDSEFSTYNLHIFDAQEQIRLRNTLLKIKKTKWLMIVKSTQFIEELYDIEGWYKTRFNKNYSVNFKNRNDQNVKHLVISNYKLEDNYGNFRR